jgi:PAT family beta-lactamase induction signal transducer AmpG
MIFGQGLLVMLAGALESSTGLPTVAVEVRAADTAPAPAAFEPGAFPALAQSGPQRIELPQESYEISFRGRPTADAKSVIQNVREWNVSHGFYAAPKTATAANGSPNDESTLPGWRVALENLIRDWFGDSKRSTAQATDRAGDVAPLLMRLVQPLSTGEQQVVQFGRVAGDASFQVVEGERFVLNEENWNEPFAAVVQVDPKLDRPSQATFEVRSGNLRLAWSVTFFIVAAAFVAFSVYHFVAMSRPAADRVATSETAGTLAGFVVPFIDFFHKPRILAILAFLLLYRFPEAQLVKLATPFLLDPREEGGLALTTGEVGFVYGTVGVVMLTLGGLIGGFVAARNGLKHWLWPMALTIHLPNLAFLFLAYAQPESLWVITAAVGIEQFGYGFGFTAYLLYCVYVARGQYETVHYALCTGFMALGMMIPGMWSGWLEELIGYRHFFVWIMLAMIPSLLAVAFVHVDSEFGKKTSSDPTA